jgi:hypothetical protein
MKKRNTAIRRIVKCIESEYTTQGEFLLWETSTSKIQEGTDVDLETFKDVFKQLQSLKLLKLRDWSNGTRTYIVGSTHPIHANRVWLPVITAQPYLLEFPVGPKHIGTRLRFHNLNYQMHVELFKAGIFAYFGPDLKGPEFSPMLPILLDILKSIQFRQTKLLTLLTNNSSKPSVIKVFPEILKDPHPGFPESFSQFVENKQLLEILGPQEKKIPTLLILVIKIISKNKTIRNKIIKSSSINKNNSKNYYHKGGDFLVSPSPTEVTSFQPILYTNSSFTKSKKTRGDPVKQQILDSFWNAQKCVFGVHRTQRVSEGFLKYSAKLPWRFRRPVNIVKQLNKNAVHPIPPRKLFTAIFAYYLRELKDYYGFLPSHNWYTSDTFYNLAEMYAIAYDEIEQFRHGAKQIGNRQIRANEQAQFDSMKKVFSRMFEKQFGVSVVSYFGIHFDFYIDWCFFRALSDFRIAKTYFEHRTGIEASLVAYVTAQIDYLRRMSLRCRIRIDWIYGLQSRSRMEVISRERKQQLAKFFAEQKMEASE